MVFNNMKNYFNVTETMNIMNETKTKQSGFM